MTKLKTVLSKIKDRVPGMARSPADGSGRRAPKILLATLVVLGAIFAGLLYYAYRVPSYGEERSLDQVYALASKGQVRTAKLLDEDALIVGERCLDAPATAPPASSAPTPGSRPAAAPAQPRCEGKVEPFHSAYPQSDVATQQLIDTLRASGALVVVDKQASLAMVKLLVTYLFPLLLLANLFALIFVARAGEGGLAEVARFGRLGRGQRKQGTTTGVSFSDVAGADESVAELREVVDYLADPARFEAYGAAVPKGVLLFGPPGCGKTLLARAVAGETGVAFFSVSGTEFVESLVGVGAARVRDLFSQVRAVAPAIVFIDEIDAVGRRRSGEGTSGGEREQTLNQLLVELDGFEVSSGIVLMGATNRPDILDQALLRPGRFDRHVTLSAPDVHGRQAILELHARGKPMAEDVDFSLLARRTPGFTGADLANVINEAALLAIREGETLISAHTLSEAVVRILHGPQRRGTLMSPDERRRIAFHEAGHAVAAAAFGRKGDVHRVSIVARGRGVGQVSADGERVLHTASEMHATLAIAMAGRAAEVLVLGEVSTAAEDDIEQASALAREMVGVHGMSPRIGNLRLLNRDWRFQGSDDTMLDSVSNQTMAAFDEEVARLVETARQVAMGVLSENRAALEHMVEDLLREESLEGGILQTLLSDVVPGPSLVGIDAGNGQASGRGAARAKRPGSPTRG